MDNNVIEFKSFKASRPRKLSAEEKVWVNKLQRLDPDDFEMINQLVTIMGECKGDINKEVELLRKEGASEYFIGMHLSAFNKLANKVLAVDNTQ